LCTQCDVRHSTSSSYFGDLHNFLFHESRNRDDFCKLKYYEASQFKENLDARSWPLGLQNARAEAVRSALSSCGGTICSETLDCTTNVHEGEYLCCIAEDLDLRRVSQ
jgi:hypothetical protein